MTPENRFVFDTNVVVSALLISGSTPAQAFNIGLNEGHVLLSAEVVEELQDVLSRSKFDRYLSREDRDRFLVKFVRAATIVEVHETVRACRDPRDDKFLSLAVAGAASCIVSSDEDLLVLHPFRSIPIVGPRDFLLNKKPAQ